MDELNKETPAKAYQCRLCDHFDVDDATDHVFCRLGHYPGDKDPNGCREDFRPVKGRGIIGAHL